MSQPTPPPYDPSTPGEQPTGEPIRGVPAPADQAGSYSEPYPGQQQPYPGQPYQGQPYQGQPQYGQAPQYAQAPQYGPTGGYYGQPTRSNNSMALVSLIAGIAGLTVLPGIASIVAVITGHMARRQIAETGEEGSGLATAGLILGWVGVGLIVLAVVGFVLFFIFIAAAGSATSSFG